MLNFLRKALTLKTPEEIEKLTPKKREKYESEAQQEYKIKVYTLLGCCKKFEDYLNKTVNEPIRWHLKFKEIFGDYLNSKKKFSRTNSLLKDIYKKLSNEKYNWTGEQYYVNIFKFSPKLPSKKSYIKRSAIDDKTIAEYFNNKFSKAIVGAFLRHSENISSQNNKLDAHSALIVAKYLKSSKDFQNLTEVNSKFNETPETLKYNPIPLTDKNRKLFPNIETLYIYNIGKDKIFTDGKIKKIYFVDIKEKVDVKEVGKKYNATPLTWWKRHTIYKNIETQFIYSNKDPIYVDGKIRKHVAAGCVPYRQGTNKIKDLTILKCRNVRLTFEHNNRFEMLKSLTISNCYSIGDSDFYVDLLRDNGPRALESLTILNCNKIGKYAFLNTEKLTSVVIRNVKLIKRNAFYWCPNLTSAKLSSVGEIEPDAFADCPKLRLSQATEQVENKLLPSIDNAYEGDLSLTELNIKDSKSIGVSTFKNCKNLKSVTISAPAGCKMNIGRNAFVGCTSLQSVTFSHGAYSIHDSAFVNCTSLRVVTFYSDTKCSGSYCFPGSVEKLIIIGNINNLHLSSKVFFPKSIKTVEYEGEISEETKIMFKYKLKNPNLKFVKI